MNNLPTLWYFQTGKNIPVKEFKGKASLRLPGNRHFFCLRKHDVTVRKSNLVIHISADYNSKKR